jgi:triacylglycerol lipase
VDRHIPNPDSLRQDVLVVLVHGFMRTGLSMIPLAIALRRRGFKVRVISQFNLSASIPQLADALKLRVEELRDAAEARSGLRPDVHFVTHSMGGIVVRSMLSRHEIGSLNRVVMMAPPNRGSRVAAYWRDEVLHLPWGSFDPLRKLLPGARGDCAGAGNPDAEVGIIAGSTSFADLLPKSLAAYWSSSFLPGRRGQHDGKVGLDEVEFGGAKDLVVVDRGHTFMMSMPEVVGHCVNFLRQGRFEHEPPPLATP